MKSTGTSLSALPALTELATDLGVDLTQAAWAELAIYRELLVARAAVEGLMSPGAVERVDEHLLDSLSIVPRLPRDGSIRSCVDVGSGAGLPGIPIAIARPDLQVTLLDASRRRAAFLARAAEALPAHPMRIVTARAETAGRGPLREAFDVAVVRAVAPLAALAELCLPLVRVGGVCLAMKTAAARSELADAEYAIDQCGGGPPLVHELSWPGLRMPRLIVQVAKIARTPPPLPRRDGRPRKRPLRAPTG